MLVDPVLPDSPVVVGILVAGGHPQDVGPDVCVLGKEKELGLRRNMIWSELHQIIWPDERNPVGYMMFLCIFIYEEKKID